MRSTPASLFYAVHKLITKESKFGIAAYYRVSSSLSSTSDSLTQMKIDSAEFRSLFTPEFNVVSQLFKKHGYELRVAGGAVRDILLGQVPHDVDLATTATPEQMTELFEKEGVRMLNKKGYKHGTITCRINDKENFEVTTLRVDKLCDGRHAEVEFTTDWLLDANRRDLTINSIFLGLDGTVHDYFNGVEDLKNRRIVFVGDAKTRIQEDYLRILRYFRFFGRFAKVPHDHNLETLEAIKKNAHGLKGISGERLWTEFKKIVVGRFAGPIVKEMLDCGICGYIGLPDSPNIDEFTKVAEHYLDHDPKPMAMVAALLRTDEEVFSLDSRLKLSNKEKFLGTFIVTNRPNLGRAEADGTCLITYFKELIIDLQSPALKLENAIEYVLELIKYSGHFDLLETISHWTPPKFPVDGVMLLQWGVRKGPAMKIVLMKLFDFWKQNNYCVTQEEFQNRIDSFYKRSMSKSPVRTHTAKESV